MKVEVLDKRAIKGYIAENRLEEALESLLWRVNECMEASSTSNTYSNLIITNLAKLRDLENNRILGVMDGEDVQRIKAQVREAALHIADRLPESCWLVNPSVKRVEIAEPELPATTRTARVTAKKAENRMPSSGLMWGLAAAAVVLVLAVLFWPDSDPVGVSPASQSSEVITESEPANSSKTISTRNPEEKSTKNYDELMGGIQENATATINQGSEVIKPTLSIPLSKVGVLSPAQKKVLGTHRLTFQNMQSPALGQVHIRFETGKITAEGRHDKAVTGEYITLNGTIKIIDADNFDFDGTIVTRLKNRNNGKPCTRDGVFRFRSAIARQSYWRMQDSSSPCDSGIDLIDISFD